MTGLEIKGRLDRIGKTSLEHFQDIKELEVADEQGLTVKDILPYKCERVEKSLKALEIIKEKRVNIGVFYHVVFILKASYDGCKASNKTVLYNICDVKKDFLTKEEFNLLKEMLE